METQKFFVVTVTTEHEDRLYGIAYEQHTEHYIEERDAETAVCKTWDYLADVSIVPVAVKCEEVTQRQYEDGLEGW